jgi:hypothetical protein
MSKLVAYNGRPSVRKGYEVIMARGQNDLELADLKLFNYLLEKAYWHLEKRSIHEIPVRDALGYLGHSSVARLEASLQRLGRVNVEIDYQQDDVLHSVTCHFLSYDVSKAEKGILQYAMDPIMLKFLWEPKVYAKINMRFFQQFRTSYGAKLYEIMALFQNRRQRTWVVSVEELREKLGVSPGQYERFDNLKKSVIDRALGEVNELATFGVSLDMVKGGRGGRVVELRFSIVPREQVELGSLGPASSKKPPRDPNTLDLLDGQTDSERGSEVVVSSEAIDQAHDMLNEAGMGVESMQGHLDEWREAIQRRRISDPNSHFLQFLQLKIDASREEDLADLDEDLFSDILKDFD